MQSSLCVFVGVGVRACVWVCYSKKDYVIDVILIPIVLMSETSNVSTTKCMMFFKLGMMV